MLKKINPKSLIGILMAVGAGIAAFATEIDNQKKEKKIEDMENRIAVLEEKGSN